LNVNARIWIESLAIVGWSCAAARARAVVLMTAEEPTRRRNNMKLHVRRNLFFKPGTLLRDLQHLGKSLEVYYEPRTFGKMFPPTMPSKLRTYARSAEQFARRVLSLPDSMESTFTPFYTKNLWGGDESVSGPGSSLKSTAKLRRELPKLLREIGARTLLDAPCGDFNCRTIPRSGGRSRATVHQR